MLQRYRAGAMGCKKQPDTMKQKREPLISLLWVILSVITSCCLIYIFSG